MNLTPLKSVRKYCLWCCCNNESEVKQCPATNCALHKFRLGKGNISVKDIRAKCIDCSGGELNRVKDCPFSKALTPEQSKKPDSNSGNYPCSLYPYRMGHNPNIKGNASHLAKIGYKPASKIPLE